MSDKDLHITKLGEHNYPQWRLNMQASLMYKGCWRLVNGTQPRPQPDDDELEDWLDREEKAAGLIWMSIEPSQQALVQAHISDPVQMWATLASLHQIESPAVTPVAFYSMTRLIR